MFGLQRCTGKTYVPLRSRIKNRMAWQCLAWFTTRLLLEINAGRREDERHLMLWAAGEQRRKVYRLFYNTSAALYPPTGTAYGTYPTRVPVGRTQDRKYTLTRCVVSHHSSFVVLVVRVELIRERSAPNALPTLSRAQRIPALDHKALNISVELGPIVVATVSFDGDWPRVVWSHTHRRGLTCRLDGRVLFT